VPSPDGLCVLTAFIEVALFSVSIVTLKMNSYVVVRYYISVKVYIYNSWLRIRLCLTSDLLAKRNAVLCNRVFLL